MNILQKELKIAEDLFEEGESLFRQNLFSDYFELFQKASKIFLKAQKWGKYIWCLHRMASWKCRRYHTVEAKQIANKALILFNEKVGEGSL